MGRRGHFRLRAPQLGQLMAFSTHTVRLKIRTCLMFLLVAFTSLLASAQNRAAAQTRRPGTGTLTVDAPIFLLPDATRTPFATLTAGTVVRLLTREGDWYKVIFRDSFLGDRTGYVLAMSIRVGDPPSPGAPESRPPASGAPQRSVTTPPSRTPTRQALAPWAERGDFRVYGMYQATSNAFSATTTLTRNVEQGSVTTSYAAVRPPALDIGGRAMAARHLAVGAAVTWMSRDTRGDVSASLPHPFFFNALRSVSGVAADLPRQEVAVHGEVSRLVPIGRAVQLAVFAGPSYFHLRQSLVIDVTANETYPYDTATFASATTVEASRSKFGYNAGLDVSGRIARRVGVGFTARYSRARVQLPATATEDVTVRVGGLQLGGGVRFGF
jgi:hypothetical protein